MTSRGPDVFLDPKKELRAWNEALEDGVVEAKGKAVPEDQVEHLGDILVHLVNAFRGALRGHPSAWMKYMAMKLKSGAEAVKT